MLLMPVPPKELEIPMANEKEGKWKTRRKEIWELEKEKWEASIFILILRDYFLIFLPFPFP